MLVRSEDKGLGNQSWEAWRHLKPHATAVVADGGSGAGLHVERYNIGTPVVVYDGHGFPDKDRLLKTFADCTHVFSIETLYDWSLADDLRRAGIKSIVQLNPELWPHANNKALPQADVWWAPTTWRIEYLPYKTRLVPVPVAADRFKPHAIQSDRVRILHVVGKAALADRNGTQTFLDSLRYLEGVDITVTFQGPNTWNQPVVGNGSTIRFVTHVGPYWTLYDDQDILVMPRRYGGLCLPVQEAMAAGLVVVMTEAFPQIETWPIVPIPAKVNGYINCLGGKVEAWDCDPIHVAIRVKEAIARFADQQALSLTWAAANSWEKLLPLYRDEFNRA